MSTKRQRLIDSVYALLVAGGTTAEVTKHLVSYQPVAQTAPDALVLLVGDALVDVTQGEEEKIEIALSVQVRVPSALNDPGDTIEGYYGYIKSTLLSGNVNAYRTFGADRARLLHTGDSGIAVDDAQDYIVGGVGLTLQYVEHIGQPDIN